MQKDADDISEVRKTDRGYFLSGGIRLLQGRKVMQLLMVLHRRMHLTARVWERPLLLQMQKEVTRLGESSSEGNADVLSTTTLNII